ncbi:MAG: glycosyltransferase, partial [Solirubrobacteraceae bacterium]
YAPLPHYDSGAQMGVVVRALPDSVRRFWRVLDDADTAWILGPNPPQALAFALLTLARRRRLVLGLRQNLPELIRHRYPHRPPLWFAASVLESAFRLLGRFVGVVVVGPDLARRYRRSKAIHDTYVSLVGTDQILPAAQDRRDYGGGELRMLSVGRLDPEKNPLLLADVLARALAIDPRWRLEVCGDGPLTAALSERLVDLGVSDRAELRGHVPNDGLLELYRSSHALIHVSHTEGVPQVLLEAFAARLPVVATAVGGVPDLVRGRGLLVGPNDAEAAAQALQKLVGDESLRLDLLNRAAEEIRDHTLEAESGRLAQFLAAGGTGSG